LVLLKTIVIGTNGVANFIWKGKCSENISFRTKHCAYLYLQWRTLCSRANTSFVKAGKIARLSSVDLKMADGYGEKKDNVLFLMSIILC
jgi:hypothetical protein